jgi:hypothetical protein
MKRDLRIRCAVTRVLKYRKDEDERGIWVWCTGHRREELATWEEMGLTREVLESLLVMMKEP